MKTFSEISLYELMAEELHVSISKSPVHGYDFNILNDEDKIIVFEDMVHQAAMDSFASLCKEFILYYERAQEPVE